MVALSPWYTGHGDTGLTQTWGPDLVPKDAWIVELLGDMDEGEAIIAWAGTQAGYDCAREHLREIQTHFSVLMSAVLMAQIGELGAYEQVAELRKNVELRIDALGTDIPLQQGWLHTGQLGGTAVNYARTVIRRIERRAVRLSQEGAGICETIGAYLNRLSSLLFQLAVLEERA